MCGLHLRHDWERWKAVLTNVPLTLYNPDAHKFELSGNTGDIQERECRRCGIKQKHTVAARDVMRSRP